MMRTLLLQLVLGVAAVAQAEQLYRNHAPTRADEEKRNFDRDFLHFGKRESGGEVDFGREFMPFGKRDDFGREFMPFGKRDDFGREFMPFGKRDEFDREFLHFGKKNDFEREFLPFGKRSEQFDRDFMPFGKRAKKAAVFQSLYPKLPQVQTAGENKATK